MTFWTRARVAAALEVPVPPGMPFSGVATDTRSLEPGALFVALRGARFDAHAFLPAAAERGAIAAVVRQGTGAVPGLTLLAVPEPLAALGRLARHRRRAVSGPVVAVTGTTGKTSTRALLAAALQERWHVHATAGNLNNEVGVPLSILAAPEIAQALVIEAGASVPGEIGRLRAIIEPDAAVITNVSAGHVEGFGSLEGVLREKASVLPGVAEAIVGTDPPALAAAARGVAGRVTVAGLAAAADIHPDGWRLDASARPVLTMAGVTVTVPLIGRHQAENAVLAVAAAHRLGVPLAAALARLDGVRLPPGRGEVHQAGGRTILYDAYNSNPASLAAALETAAALRHGRPLVIVVGTMLELGALADAEHRRLAAMIAALEPALVGAVGAFVPALTASGLARERLVTADDAERLGCAVAARAPADAVVLLKASRGVRLERALPPLLAT